MTRKTWSGAYCWVVVAALLGLAGCTGSPGTGTLTGRFAASGGPLGLAGTAGPRPLHGSVTVEGPGGRHVVATGSDGSYRLTLPPGTYSVTAEVPGGTGPCQADRPVTVTSGRTSRADVVCHVR
ncbi:carboxypeptidase regulatory-like domain-containing protein [Planosporangium thailandense]|uniref:Carboxypeptidase regulatory-like domain-containing protein n=1 Tax=Planosporangium thailandense TaxID=765197 RepID=A0ABX0XW85_9ACTN|nr:carboxypeptidase-like regulatory domain-containing protein [Planosporangium thailandense]NJC70068.1 carboxypeptidase regulatory-like domain-containing protein [Planosporangium thailandense]